jgi:hypothetical protein
MSLGKFVDDELQTPNAQRLVRPQQTPSYALEDGSFAQPEKGDTSIFQKPTTKPSTTPKNKKEADAVQHTRSSQQHISFGFMVGHLGRNFDSERVDRAGRHGCWYLHVGHGSNCKRHAANHVEFASCCIWFASFARFGCSDDKRE